MVLPSLELNWLKADKDIPIPLVIFDDVFAGGYYCSPEKDEEYINGKYYPLDKGILAINNKYTDDFIINAIAHEWRHHWQWWNDIESDCKCLDMALPYEEMIIQYFLNSVTEMDALLFSNKMHPSEDSLEWYEWLIKYKY